MPGRRPPRSRPPEPGAAPRRRAEPIPARSWSWVLGAFADGQIAERGGELIDQGHKAVRHLAKELGLALDNVLAAEAKHTEQTSWFDGARYSYDEGTADVKAAWQKIHKDLSGAGYPTTYYQSTERGRELDAMSIVDWIEETFEGGMSSKVGQLLDVAYTIEYGADSSEQSSLNLLYLLGFRGQGNLRIFGPRTRSTACAAATTRSRTGWPLPSTARSRPGPSSWPCGARPPDAGS